MSVIGKIIRNKVLEFNIMRMEISMKEDGLRIKDIIKEHYGLQMERIN
jgi:hypothetical protein